MNKVISLLHHLFVPHEDNQYQARTTHLDFLSFYLVLALFLTFGYRFFPQTSFNVLGVATDITVERLYQLTNEMRQRSKLPPFRYSQKLSKAADLKAQDMFAKNYWAHYAPDGKTPWEFILAADYQYEYAGENLAKNFLFSQGVVDAWMSSPSHRENILKKEYQDVGFAVLNGVLNGEETTLVVQMFGSPQKLKANVEEEKPSLAKNVVYQETISQSQPMVLSQKKTRSLFSYRFNLIFFSFLIIAFFSDFYFAQRLGLFHWQKKNIFHLMFFFFVLISILIISRGAII